MNTAFHFAKWSLAAIGVLATFIGLYEYFWATRTAPYLNTHITSCSPDQVSGNFGNREAERQEFLQFLNDNAWSLVVLDLIIDHDGCDHPDAIYFSDEFPEIVEFELGYDERYSPTLGNHREFRQVGDFHDRSWYSTVRFEQKRFFEDVLANSSFGDDHGAHGIVGVFFVSNMSDEEGTNRYVIVPIRYSTNNALVFSCTVAIESSFYGLSRLSSYVSECLL